MRNYLNIDRPATIFKTLQIEAEPKGDTVSLIEPNINDMSLQEYMESGFAKYFAKRRNVVKETIN